MSKVYFKNLHGLRFIAAFAVILHHIEQSKSIYGIKNFWHLNFVKNLGNIGVQFFFVLSGFLITYLLLSEKKSKGIDYKKFILRRIYRIWPLYFIIILLSFFIAPNFEILKTPFTWSLSNNFYIKLICVCLFIPNVVFRLLKTVPLASQTWSIGVEEQFYVIWPILIKKITKPYVIFFLIITLYVITKILIFNLSIIYSGNKLVLICSKIINEFSLSGFVLGAIGANILFTNNIYILEKIKNIHLLRITFILFTLLILKSSSESFYSLGVVSIENELFCILFVIFIINFIRNDKLKISLENRIINYLGKVSYGLYMYHPICITLIINLTLKYDSLINYNLMYPLSILLTIIMSSISYEFIEKPFLKMKKY